MIKCTVKQDEKMFDKIEKYYKEGLIKVKFNTHEVFFDDKGNEISDMECKILIPVSLKFNFEKVKEFIKKDENRWIILDYIVKKSRKYWTNIEFHVKIGHNNIFLIIKYMEVFRKDDL